jgi:ArsR family transcriptional regulator
MNSLNNDSEKILKAANMLKSIAHPTRLKILNLLKDTKEYSVTKIHLQLSCKQPTISHHLSIMKNKGVLKSRQDGKNIFYSIKKDAFVDCINKSILQNIENLLE